MGFVFNKFTPPTPYFHYSASSGFLALISKYYAYVFIPKNRGISGVRSMGWGG